MVARRGMGPPAWSARVDGSLRGTKMHNFAQTLADVRKAAETINNAAQNNEGELPELLAEVKFGPETFAQILMNHLPMDAMLVDDKVFWLKVVEYMGSDYLAEFRKVGGFMAKTHEF